METTHDGNGIISIRLPSSVQVRVETLNNDLLGVGSLIPHGSELYSRVSSLSVGDLVLFSGMFGEDHKDYVSEPSMTERGSMTDPELLFRFSDIRKPGQSPPAMMPRETVLMTFEFISPDTDGSETGPPEVLDKVAPEYSDEARQANFSGKVTATASVDFNGNVDFVRVMESPGIGLTQNVEAALQKWKFRPAMKAGQPVPSRVSVVFTFSRSE
jgi:TonB family protein